MGGGLRLVLSVTIIYLFLPPRLCAVCSGSTHTLAGSRGWVAVSGVCANSLSAKYIDVHEHIYCSRNVVSFSLQNLTVLAALRGFFAYQSGRVVKNKYRMTRKPLARWKSI
jgi:hypothetical protein